jgi:hypothetical protein
MTGKLSRLRIIGLCGDEARCLNGAVRDMVRLAQLNRIPAINAAGVRSH